MDTIPLDYATLRLIWWLLLGILLIGFAVMDGFDLGVATLLPAVARTDEERRIVLLHAVTGLKHRELAALLELPLPTVLSKYHRALKKMRSFLEGDDA